MSVNKVILIGNVGKDPDVRYLDTGIAVATFSLAQTAEKYVRKGDKLYIEGKIRSRSYDDQNGIKRTIVEIFADNMEMLTPRNTSQQPGTGYVPQAQAVSRQQVSAQTAPQQQQVSDNSLTDDLPF